MYPLNNYNKIENKQKKTKQTKTNGATTNFKPKQLFRSGVFFSSNEKKQERNSYTTNEKTYWVTSLYESKRFGASGCDSFYWRLVLRAGMGARNLDEQRSRSEQKDPNTLIVYTDWRAWALRRLKLRGIVAKSQIQVFTYFWEILNVFCTHPLSGFSFL